MARVVGKSAQYWSSFSPSNIPGLALWYDFSDRSTFDLSGDYVITRVRDKSGQGRHGTASNGAGAAWIYDGASKGAKGLPANIPARFVFDVCLSASQPLFSGAGAFTSMTTGDTDIVSPTGAGGLIFRYSGGSFESGNTADWAGSGANSVDLLSTCVASFSGGLQNNQYKTIPNGAYLTGATAEINAPQVGSGLGLRIGPYTTNFNHGIHHELLLFSNALSDYDRSAVEEYLIQKWMKPYVPTITAPTDISGCTLWLDTSGGAANFTLSGSNILKWLDKSGNNYDVSTTSATFPTWQDTSGYVHFLANNTMRTTAPLPPVGEETGFVLGVKITNSTVIDMIGAATGSTGASRRIMSTNATNQYIFRQLNGTAVSANMVYASGIANSTSPQVLTWQTRGSEAVAKISGQTTGYTTGLGTTTNTVGVTQIGPAAHHYREIILYNRVLSGSEMSNVEAYLFNKWGLSNIKTFTKLPSNRVYSSTNPAIVRPLRIPYDIPNCTLWLDAKDSNTIQLDPSGNVLRWLDKSGWGNDVSGGASRPNYSNETVVFNSNSMTVRNSNLSATGFRFDPPFNMRFHTFIALHKPTTATGNTGLIDFSVTTNTCNVSFPTVDLSFATTPRGYVNSSAASALRTTSTFVENSSTTEYNIVTAAAHLFRFIIYRNGVVQQDVCGPIGTNLSFTGSTGLTSIGRWGNNNTRFYQGELKELFVFDRPLAPYSISQVESYLAKKWNLTNLLPSNHIAFTAPAPMITNVSPPATLETALWLDATTYASEYSNNATITTNWSNRATFPTAVVPAGTPKFLTNAWQGRPGIDMTSGSFSTTFLTDASLAEAGHQTFIVASYNTGAPNTTRTALFFRFTPTANLKHSVLQIRPLDASLGTQFINPNGTTVNGTYVAPPPVSAGSPFLFEIGQNSIFDVGWSVNGNTLSNLRTGMALNGNSTNTSYGWAGIGQDSGTDTTPTWNGIIHEIITFPMNRVTTFYFDNQHRFLIRAYLARKWGILNLLPAYPDKGTAV